VYDVKNGAGVTYVPQEEMPIPVLNQPNTNPENFFKWHNITPTNGQFHLVTTPCLTDCTICIRTNIDGSISMCHLEPMDFQEFEVGDNNHKLQSENIIKMWKHFGWYGFNRNVLTFGRHIYGHTTHTNFIPVHDTNNVWRYYIHTDKDNGHTISVTEWDQQIHWKSTATQKSMDLSRLPSGATTNIQNATDEILRRLQGVADVISHQVRIMGDLKEEVDARTEANSVRHRGPTRRPSHAPPARTPSGSDGIFWT